MNTKPIGPTTHGAIDYGFVTLQALAPTLFHLKGSARTLCYAFAGTQGLINTFTDHPLGLKPFIPLRVHGQLETPFVPALVVLPWLTGALKQRNARRFFFSFFAVALANYLLTDYKANERKESKPDAL
ncbi:hypothetical protein [Rufibacter sp. XAAS-G3-1]|uniref:hypothetical protein n=1 Tax=Rufibacter sp. XAAS-G3-1 TaxID=2729134 RepID=UPI0015E738C3|nr:hypothetical protein [Rufibacter sp. XAAS-G3-1]